MKRAFVCVAVCAALFLGACGGETKVKKEEVQTLVFADLTWTSVQVHNRIVAFIAENGFGGYKADYTPGDTLVTLNGVMNGDIDIDMESWHSNFREAYDKGMASGDLIDLGKNLPDAPQGWWVPRYLVEGPDALAPDLKGLEDLPKYWELFKDPEDRSKGLIYMGITGWACTEISEDMFSQYGLGETYNQSIPGSSAALAASMVGAYQKGEPWVGYYWAPTAVMGRLDMVRLKGSEFEAADVNILVNKNMPEKAPDVVELLKKYSTTVEQNNEFLAKMEEMQWDTQKTAEWFLKEHSEIWTPWVSEEVASRVKSALAEL